MIIVGDGNDCGVGVVEEAPDRGRRGLHTVEATLAVVFLSGAYSIRNRMREIDDQHDPNPTDHSHILQTTLVGAVLFLALMIEILHHHIRELRIGRKNIESIKLSAEIKALKEEKAKLRIEQDKAKLSMELKQLKSDLICRKKKLESDLHSKTKDVDVAQATVIALRKQSERFHRLLEENQSLRKQLQLRNYNSWTGDCHTQFPKSICRKRNRRMVDQGGADLGPLASSLEFESWEWKKTLLRDPCPVQKGIRSGHTGLVKFLVIRSRCGWLNRDEKRKSM